MDSNLHTSPPDAKATFRKPSNDASNRQYRHRSPVSRLSSPEGSSPQRDCSVSPMVLGDDLVKCADTQPGRDGRDLDRDSSRNRYSRNGESYRYSDRQSSKSTHGYSRHDDYVRNDKRADEDSKYKRLSSRSGESRVSTHSDHPRKESDHIRSKDYSRADKYSHDRYDGSGHRSRDKEKEAPSLEHQKYKDKDSSFDRVGSGRRYGNSISEEMDRDRRRRGRDGRDEKGDYHRSSGDRRGEKTASYEESRGHRNDSSSGRERDNDKHHLKEGYKSGLKDVDGRKPEKKERLKYDEGETNLEKDKYGGFLKEQSEEKSIFDSKNHESPIKKPKLFDSGKGIDYADEKRPSLEKAEESGGRVTVGQAHGNDVDITNDLNAAKIAAMKAAELVNRNLIGAGHSNMTTEQKKKLLWGSKKSTPAEESGHHWDTTLFGDRERQEKFNKLMSLRLPWYLWPIVGCERGREGGAQTGQAGWQWSPSSREAAGTPAGFGEAVHCWTSTKGRSHCWIRSLSIKTGNLWCYVGMLCDILLYFLWKDFSCYGILRKNMLLLDVSRLSRWF
ncbi:arginine/serine-rich coiled-coil protein 2 isoform X3 [Durio zibethinus]|uniref:Arginine/serine-rich coiled-coil protein 2 isoform X3 n=1 Tax=Durio zibethinus TaxID=66656 RepID=A0A6P5YW81_DURZI|nr:arginine/serine-rich coiled-coil protein 2 isoform X3 [Durio zibethinus]